MLCILIYLVRWAQSTISRIYLGVWFDGFVFINNIVYEHCDVSFEGYKIKKYCNKNILCFSCFLSGNFRCRALFIL